MCLDKVKWIMGDHKTPFFHKPFYFGYKIYVTCGETLHNPFMYIMAPHSPGDRTYSQPRLIEANDNCRYIAGIHVFKTYWGARSFLKKRISQSMFGPQYVIRKVKCFDMKTTGTQDGYRVGVCDSVKILTLRNEVPSSPKT